MKTLNTRLWADQPDPVPASVPEPVPAPVPEQDEPKTRTTRRTRRAARRTARAAARTTPRKEVRPEPAPKPVSPPKAPKIHKPSRAQRLQDKIQKKLAEKASEPAMTPDARRGLMGMSRRGALVLITVLDLAATAVSFGESWDALYQWALKHGLSGFWAFVFPLQIDTFIAMGELALFIAIIDHWHWKNRVWAWVSVFGGLAVSMIGNVGHVHGHAESWQATAAVPPLAAMAGMFIGFQVLKRVMNPSREALRLEAATEPDTIAELRSQIAELSRAPQPAPEPVPAPRPEPASVPAQRVHPDGYVLEDPAPIVEPLGYIADVTKEGGPITDLYPRPAADMVPAPVRVPARPKRGQKHPKWDNGVKLYRESKTEDNPQGFSQRELAAALDMQNRGLAARIIDHVDNGTAGE